LQIQGSQSSTGGFVETKGKGAYAGEEKRFQSSRERQNQGDFSTDAESGLRGERETKRECSAAILVGTGNGGKLREKKGRWGGITQGNLF